jgi:hypothetical protein
MNGKYSSFTFSVQRLASRRVYEVVERQGLGRARPLDERQGLGRAAGRCGKPARSQNDHRLNQS